jgi:hypothetical protein
VGWSRLTAGRIRDPLVGRELLTGLAAGAAAVVLGRALLLAALGNGMGLPVTLLNSVVSNSRFPALYAISANGGQAITYTIGALIFILMLRLVLRNTVAAVIGVTVIYALLLTGAGGLPSFASAVIGGVILFVLLFRSGAVTFGAAILSSFTLNNAPLTFRFGEPFAGTGLSVALAVIAVGVMGFWIALAGKPWFGTLGSEEEAPA